ncbi:hypothetical protein EAG_12635 [Camponotus floridanus]|uniref:Uncharacterized protein n=1 Tax=Camponotus floridanus TaxID=104421 RepID=E2AWI2_CAMFO|nr:hypothetical protein EAG_12635 [Camponotus floridanus]
MEVSRWSARKWVLGQLDSSWSPKKTSVVVVVVQIFVRCLGRAGFGRQTLLLRREERGGGSAAAAASHESPYSCHPEFLDGRMTSLSSYGFVFGSTDSIDTSAKGSSLGTFFFDLSCPRLSHKDSLGLSETFSEMLRFERLIRQRKMSIWENCVSQHPREQTDRVTRLIRVRMQAGQADRDRRRKIQGSNLNSG